MKKPERAIYIAGIRHLKYWKPGFSRLCFGNEFCPNLAPSPDEVKTALAFASRRGLTFSLLTCQADDRALKKFLKLLPLLRAGDELILNDWGLLNAVKKKFRGLLPSCVIGKFLACNLNLRNPRSREFLEGQGLAGPALERLELDGRNFLPGYADFPAFAKAGRGFRLSLYYPYFNFALSRLCPTAAPRRAGAACLKECRARTFTAGPPELPRQIFLKGNAWFAAEPPPPCVRNSPSVDRLVYMPALPM